MKNAPLSLFAFDVFAPAHLTAGSWRAEGDQGHRYTDLKYWVDVGPDARGRQLRRHLLRRHRRAARRVRRVGRRGDARCGAVPDQRPDGAGQRHGGGDRASHLRGDLLADLRAALPAGAPLQQPRPPHRRPRRLEHRDLLLRIRGAQPREGAATGPAERYELAEEYMQVVYKLWESSFDEDAVVRDAAAATYVDPAKVHPIDHTGEYFTVPGVPPVRALPAAHPHPVPGRGVVERNRLRRQARRGSLHPGDLRRGGQAQRGQDPAGRGQRRA